MRKITILLLGIGMLLLVLFLFKKQSAVVLKPPITNFIECMAAGFPVAESHPRQCTAGGYMFVEDIENKPEKADLIVLDIPRPNQVITSPMEVRGKARGQWFFEADFPVRLLDGDGKEIAVGSARAQEDWMTDEFVSFSAELVFEAPKTDAGELVLEKSNPSGLTENADQLKIPIRFR